MITNLRNNHLFIFAKITPKPEHYLAARDALAGIVERTRSEEGCHAFSLLENESEGLLCLYEEFTDEAALDYHYRQSYTQEVFELYKDWLASAVEVTKMQYVA
ncbi:putative quinol monooxygenase [Phytoactinopolyspora mesophila]|uniref:Antibiotic biosynthesis monooxygenase n=1 Tax=Phytoactinopolyspora mesophila TaxID=2650750 RepID=A0A7K3M515_9ACTN|nr:putative quinol monooxygenase [Phytoactinopolyspora mesophila]NDL58336.1 antibiotic biosynthesis monooxygenase [Phytoactinopolyspora mesophila]